jgi:hypothetical protein
METSQTNYTQFYPETVGLRAVCATLRGDIQGKAVHQPFDPKNVYNNFYIIVLQKFRKCPQSIYAPKCINSIEPFGLDIQSIYAQKCINRIE